MKLFLVTMLAYLVVLGCSATPGPVEPVPDPVDPEPVPVTRTDCEAAEARLSPPSADSPEGLGCRDREGAPYWQTSGGTPYSEACERAAADGRNWHPHAMSCITSCDQVEAVHAGRIDPCQH